MSEPTFDVKNAAYIIKKNLSLLISFCIYNFNIMENLEL